MMYRRILQPPLGSAIKASWLLKSHPYIPAAEKTLIATNANIGIAKAAYFPQISGILKRFPTLEKGISHERTRQESAQN
jgi:hypothetical protein